MPSAPFSVMPLTSRPLMRKHGIQSITGMARFSPAPLEALVLSMYRPAVSALPKPSLVPDQHWKLPNSTETRDRIHWSQ